MAFEGLSEKLSAAFKKLRGKGRLSEADVKEAMREIRLALLEADVSYKVVKQFIAQVTERAVGSDVLEALSPAQTIIKIVNEELTALMGGTSTKLEISSKPPHGGDAGGPSGCGQDHQQRQAGRPDEASERQAAPCWPPAISTAPPPSSSWRWWADSWTSRCSRWVRPTRWTSPEPPSSTPGSTATTWCSWTPPAGSMWTRS